MEMWQNLIDSLSGPSGPALLLLLVLSVLSLLMASAAVWRIRSLTRPLARIRRQSGNPADILPAVLRAVEENEGKIERAVDRLNALSGESRGFIRHIGLVRYDALEEIAGKQSYTLCLLDQEQNGVLITYLSFKNATRSHAVSVRAGQPSRELGEEEARAMREALAG